MRTRVKPIHVFIIALAAVFLPIKTLGQQGVAVDRTTKQVVQPPGFWDSNKTAIEGVIQKTNLMQKGTYDSGNNGIVDNAEQLGGQALSAVLNRASHTGQQTRSTISDFAHSSTHGPAGSDPLPWTAINGYGPTTNRPSATSTNAGWLWFNTTTSAIQRSNGTNWVDFSVTASGSGVDTNGGSPGFFVVLRSDMTLGTTGALQVISLTVQSNLTVNGAIIPSTPIALGNIAPEVLSEAEAVDLYQPLSDNLTPLSLNNGGSVTNIDDDKVEFDDADSLWTATKIGPALEELNDSINGGVPNGSGAKVHWSELLGVPPGFADNSDDGSGGGAGETNTASNLGTQSSTVQGLYKTKSGTDLQFRSVEAGTGVTITSNANTLVINSSSSFTWDVDTRFSITNTGGAMETVYTEAVPDGQTRSFDLQLLMAGATNGYQGSLFGRLSNRGGTTLLFTTNGPGGTTDTNTVAFVTNSGTNMVVLARGPSYQPFNGHLRGTRQIVTNAGSYASSGIPETNGLFAYWAMSGTGSTAETDLMGNLTLAVSAGDTIPTTNSTPLQPARYFNDGEDDYMSASNLVFASTDSFTIGGWVRADSPAATRYIMGRASAFSLRMASTDSTMRFVVANATTNKEVTGHNLGSATNYFFGASYNNTNGVIQLLICSPLGNNLYSGTFAPGVEPSTNDLYISAAASSTTLNWAGAIDDIWLSKRAMPTNVLIQIYNSGSGLPLASWPVN